MRSLPYVSAPSELIRENIELIQSQIRFVIDARGPTKFLVKPIGTKEQFMVSIGFEQRCTCESKEICIHILYIMIRYFGVPTDCDLLWQRSLTENEIGRILDRKIKINAPTKPPVVYRTKSGKTKVKRLTISEEDVCPICYDTLHGCPKEKIAWCRTGCGGNFHRKCVKEWIASRRNHGEDPTCPICRSVLDTIGINAPPKPKVPDSQPPNLTEAEIRELMSRDITPDDYAVLLRLDEHRHNPQTRPTLRKKNARTNAAAAILSNPRTPPMPSPEFCLTNSSTHNIDNTNSLNQAAQQRVFHRHPIVQKRVHTTMEPQSLDFSIKGTTLIENEPMNPPKSEISSIRNEPQCTENRFVLWGNNPSSEVSVQKRKPLRPQKMVRDKQKPSSMSEINLFVSNFASFD